MGTPLVSITSASYNTGSIVLEMVKSIYAQRFTDWELVLLDDCSKDNTYEILKSIADPRVRVYKNQHNRGIPASLNTLTELSRGRYIARMDSDDLSARQRILKQVEFMESNPDIDVVGTGMIYLDKNDRPLGKGKIFQDHSEICRNPSKEIGLAHPTILAKKEWFEMFKYRERIARTSDYNLLLRAHKKSQYANILEYLFYYRIGFSFNLKKECISRICFWKSVKDYYAPYGRYDIICKVFVVSYLKFMYELGYCLLGKKEKASRHRYSPLTQTEIENYVLEIRDILICKVPLKSKTI